MLALKLMLHEERGEGSASIFVLAGKSLCRTLAIKPR